jgi:hypothetical protein
VLRGRNLMSSETNVGRSWAKLRQVIIAAADNAAAGALLRSRLGVGTGFVDPGLETIDMDDTTIPLGNGSFLEIISPRDASTSLGRWLAKAGGSGGYMLAIQHSDVVGVRRRAREMGIAEVLADVVQGYELAQFSPWELGLIIEVDGIPDPAVWYWDHLDVQTQPDATVNDILGVEVAVKDPDAVAAVWNTLLDLEAGGTRRVNLGGRYVSFVAGEGKPKMTAITLRLAHDQRRAAESLLGLQVNYV